MPELFVIDVYGQFRPGEVRVRWRDQPRPPHPVLDALVAEVWREQTEACRRAGRVLFNGRLARYLGHQVADGVLTIEVGPTDYADFLATNLLNYPRGEELGWHLFSNAMGSSAVAATSDGQLILGRRNQRVAFHAGYVHIIGGGLEEVDRCDDGTVDAFAAAQRELIEELAVRPEEVGGMICLGFIHDPSIRQPELIFDGALRLTFDVVAGRLDAEDPHQEHAKLLACPDEPEAIVPFVRANQPVTPVAVGALCLHGRRRFGEEWYERTIRELGA